METMDKILRAYGLYVVAYDKYIAKYLVNKNEDDCTKEIPLCDKLYNKLQTLVDGIEKDEERAYQIMGILSTTDSDSKRVTMTSNIIRVFDFMEVKDI